MIRGSTAAMRAAAASTSSSGETSPRRSRCTASTAVSRHRSVMIRSSRESGPVRAPRDAAIVAPPSRGFLVEFATVNASRARRRTGESPMKPAESGTRTGAQLLVDALRLHGTDTVFGVPGESYLAVLDALHDVHDFRLVICRQEGGAANMAEAYGKLTGRPGICFVTRGPAPPTRPRHPHRLPGFHADDPVHRPDRHRRGRARGVPGDRLPPHVRADVANGSPRSTAPTACPST